jgi:hypothetical protein
MVALLEFAKPAQIVDGRGAMKSGVCWSPARFNPGIILQFEPGNGRRGKHAIV